jgi:type II secretion system protein N
VIDSGPSSSSRGSTAVPLKLALPLALLLIFVFVVILFPWESLTRRLTWEIGRASGGRIEIGEIGPGLTARGPVLRARNVQITHPALERVSVSTLELAPRPSMSWLRGEPALRVWADSELGVVDGVVALGAQSSFVGRVDGVPLERLPLRVDSSGVALSGRVDAAAEVELDPRGALVGRIDFEGKGLILRTSQLPLPLPFAHAQGRVEILESGATCIEGVKLEGEAVEGELSGEIGLVHRSASPPLDIRAELRILSPVLRQLAPDAGFALEANGETSVLVRGTLENPRIESLASNGPTRGPGRVGRRRAPPRSPR